jgi:predicted DNA binding CopG/RHH family protein
MKELPALKSEKAEREFWKTHSVADYWDDLQECSDTLKRPKLLPVTVKFDPILLKKIRMLAKKRGISYNAYIRYLLAKGVESDLVPVSKSFRPTSSNII